MTREQKLEKVLRYIGWLGHPDRDSDVDLTAYLSEMALLCASDDDRLDAMVEVIEATPDPTVQA